MHFPEKKIIELDEEKKDIAAALINSENAAAPRPPLSLEDLSKELYENDSTTDDDSITFISNNELKAKLEALKDIPLTTILNKEAAADLEASKDISNQSLTYYFEEIEKSKSYTPKSFLEYDFYYFLIFLDIFK
jgi:hypothetical protein